MEVLRLIGTGATNREIADRLVVSEGTVKNHVSSILSRLGLRDRTQAALFAHEHGLTLGRGEAEAEDLSRKLGRAHPSTDSGCA